MYYFQIGGTIALIVGIVVSLIYLLSLSIKVATNRLNRREAMFKSFIVAFSASMSIFLIGFIWEDKTSWNIREGIMVFMLYFLVSTIIATISALGYWRWRH